MLILLFYNCLIAGFIIIIITCNYNYFYYFCYYCVEDSARLVYGDTDCFNNCHSLIIINSPRIIILKRGIHMMYIIHISLSCIQLSYMHPQSLSYHASTVIYTVHPQSLSYHASTVIYTVHPQSLSYHASTVTQ